MKSWIADKPYVESVVRIPLTSAQSRSVFEVEIHVSAPKGTYRAQVLQWIGTEVRF